MKKDRILKFNKKNYYVLFDKKDNVLIYPGLFTKLKQARMRKLPDECIVKLIAKEIKN